MDNKSKSLDPREITAKFHSQCHKCKKEIQKGDIIYYFPLSKNVYCINCDEDYNNFLNEKELEEINNHNFWGGQYV